MDASHLQQLLVFLTHLNDASADWAEFAKDRGISRKDNAATGFKAMIKKYGLEYTNNKTFVPVAGFELGTNPVPASATKPKKALTPRKRKADDNDDVNNKDDAEMPTPSKKPRGKKSAKSTPEALEDGVGGTVKVEGDAE